MQYFYYYLVPTTYYLLPTTYYLLPTTYYLLKMSIIQNKASALAVLIICLSILFGHFTLPKWKYNYYDQELTFDVTSYYLYLPMTFIYKDPAIKNKAVIDTVFNRYHPSPTFYQAFQLENGNYVMNYTCGFAYAYAPFFFIADLWAKAKGSFRDGFSFPYQFCISNGVFIYILLGWLFLRKVLLKFFSDHEIGRASCRERV